MSIELPAVRLYLEAATLTDLTDLTAEEVGETQLALAGELRDLRRKEELLALQGRLEIEDNWRQLRENKIPAGRKEPS